MIAATAIHHGLTVVTRNTKDFAPTQQRIRRIASSNRRLPSRTRLAAELSLRATDRTYAPWRFQNSAGVTIA